MATDFFKISTLGTSADEIFELRTSGSGALSLFSSADDLVSHDILSKSGFEGLLGTFLPF